MPAPARLSWSAALLHQQPFSTGEKLSRFVHQCIDVWCIGFIAIGSDMLIIWHRGDLFFSAPPPFKKSPCVQWKFWTCCPFSLKFCSSWSLSSWIFPSCPSKWKIYKYHTFEDIANILWQLCLKYLGLIRPLQLLFLAKTATYEFLVFSFILLLA